MFRGVIRWLRGKGIFIVTLWSILLLSAICDLLFLDRVVSLAGAASTAALFAVAVTIPFRPRLHGWVFLLLDTVLVAGESVPVGILGYACAVVFFLWGWNKYAVDATVGMIILLTGFCVGFSFQILGALMLLIILGTSFGGGYMMRHYVDERNAVVRQLYDFELQQLKASQQLRNALAVQLHDSLAGTLSVVTKLAETLRNEMPKGSALELKASLLDEKARISLKELREIIQLLDDPSHSSDKEISFMSELRRMEYTISALGFNLKLEYDGLELTHISPEKSSVLSAFLREVSTNLVKYAAPATNAFVSVFVVQKQLRLWLKISVSA